MKGLFLVILMTLILGILETTVVSLPLLFLWVVCFAIVGGEKESFWLGFLSGLWLDFLKGGRWGSTSLYFLSICFLISLYKRKFKVVHPLYFFSFGGVALLVYFFYEFGEILVQKLPMSFLLAIGLFKIAQALTPKEKKLEL